MKVFFVLLFLAMNARAQMDFTEVDKKIDSEFSSRPEVIPAMKNHMRMIVIHNQNVDDVDKWFKARMDMVKSLQCLNFHNSSTDLEKNQFSLIRELTLIEKFKEAQVKDFQLLMQNRDKRREMMAVSDTEALNSHVFCNGLDATYVAKRRLILEQDQKKEMTSGTDFSMFHPRDAKILKSLELTAIKQKMQPNQKNKFIFETYTSTIAPILDSKASLEFLPMVEKKCPGVTERLWNKCKTQSIYQNKLFQNTPKMYCVQDYEKEIDPRCLQDEP